jgi:hypothetical protein
MKRITRVDAFANIDEYVKFMEWAKTKEPKTRADMVRLLGEYKKPDLYIDAHPEHVEHEIVKELEARRKGGQEWKN